MKLKQTRFLHVPLLMQQQKEACAQYGHEWDEGDAALLGFETAASSESTSGCRATSHLLESAWCAETTEDECSSYWCDKPRDECDTTNCTWVGA